MPTLLTGEAAVAHNGRILDAVSKEIGGDELRMKEFKSATRNLGKGKVTCAEVSHYSSAID